MNVTRTDQDKLNATLTIHIDKADYQPTVDKTLADYKKNANIPGFRKGMVPMGMIKKQYGMGVMAEEVNKLIQKALNDYLSENKIDILGQPLPDADQEIDWNADDFKFDFQLGLAPEFDVKLKSKKAIDHYVVEPSDEMIEDQIKNIRSQYGSIVSQDKVEENSEITGRFVNEELEIDNRTTFKMDEIKGKTNAKKFLGATAGSILELKSKNLFEADGALERHLGVVDSDKDVSAVALQFYVDEINTRELATMDQAFFDKLFGESVVTSEDELKARLKEDATKQFSQQSDQKLLNDVTERLIEETKFDLPEEFLTKWIAQAGEKELNEEEAKAEFERSEKGLRYQLIENKLITDNKLQLEFEELKNYASTLIRQQMAQYGNTDATDQEVDKVVLRIMSNQDEVKRLSEQLQNEKMLNFLKENANLKEKKVSYEDFIKEAYGA